MSTVRYAATWLAAIAITSCADGTAVPAPALAPSVSGFTVNINSNNALSLVVSFAIEHADSARVRYESAADTADVTPFCRMVATRVTKLAVVGLRPSTTYSLVVEGIGPGGRVTSEPQSATTGELPSPIRSLRLTGIGRASSGLTLVVPLLPDTAMTADGFVVAFDGAGEIRWYSRFPGAWPVEAKQQPNGHITVFAGRTYGWQPLAGSFVELTPGGDVVRTFAVASNYYTDPHELLLTFRDTTIVAATMLGYEIRDFDLSAIGGSVQTPLAVHTIERRSAAGAVLFRWSAATLFTVADWPLPNPHAVDLAHPSSLAIAPDGGYVASFQGMDEITKIDSTSGAIVWRFGGRHNQFEIRDDPLRGFLGQHNVQVLGNGNLLMMDDHYRGSPRPARAVEYSLDTREMVARMVWEYRPSDGVISPIMGSAQRLANGSTLVGFGSAGRVDEVESDGRVAWSVTLRTDASAAAIPFYRAVRLQSLYEYRP